MKKRHHYVPVGLSRSFCSMDNERFLYLYDVKNDKIILTSPKNVFVIGDFHTIDQGKGNRDRETVENALCEFEDKGIKALRELIRTRALNEESRWNIANFWAIQLLRTPVVRAGVAEFLKETVRVSGRILDNQGKLPALPEELSEYGRSFTDLINKGVVDIELTLPHMTMMAFTALPNVAECLYSMKWCLLESIGNNYFCLSDNPCSIYDEDYQTHNLGIGIGHPGVEVGIPISRNHCLVAAWKSLPSFARGTSKRVTEVNKRTALFGEQYFAFSVKSKKMMECLQRYGGGVPQMEPLSFPVPQENGRKGYLIMYSLRFVSERHHRSYTSLRPLFSRR